MTREISRRLLTVGIMGLVASLMNRGIVNLTPSVPKGLYWLQTSPHLAVEAIVALRTPPQIRQLIRERYLRNIEYLLKPIAAMAPDHVCIREGQLYINHSDTPLSAVRERDDNNRLLPAHPICRRLRSGELYLASSNRVSVDSRHFGPVTSEQLHGSVLHIW